jgi:RNA-directed DNA polymerase
MEERVQRLKQVICGWVNYFGIADMKKLASKMDEWLRRRIRMCYWKQWKKIVTKHNNLIQLGLNDSKAWEYANTRKSYWRVSNSPILSRTLTNEFLKNLGFCTVTERYALIH